MINTVMSFKPLKIFFLCIASFGLCLPTLASKQSLENDDWLYSLEKRALLRFITECALRKDQFLSIESDGLIFEFYGKLGVAPEWNGYPSSLTPSKQRWVSACVLARVNYFGKPVPINLRTEENSGFYIPVTDNELNNFPYHEGGYFGNIFEYPPKKYVCKGDAPEKLLVGKSRICSLGSMTNKKQSECGFIIVGSCDEEMFRERDGIFYDEIFHVWLKMH